MGQRKIACSVQNKQEILGIWEKLKQKVPQMMQAIGDKSPHAGVLGIYDNEALDWWTSGFWPGILWIMYDMTGDESYKQKAWDWDERIEACFLRDNRFHHDLGFQFSPTAVIKYKITGDKDAKRRALQASRTLAGRFNPVGKFIRAWNQPENAGLAIIDSCMNLSLLFWAEQEMPDPLFAHVAKMHADTVISKFMREDGSVRHMVFFDPVLGTLSGKVSGGQGFAPDSAWSRGQAWALYGLANTARYTNDMKYLEAAQRVAHFFLASLPHDMVPLWDFRTTTVEGEPKDTSAASCAASGLLEIASLLPETQGRLYHEAAERIICSLAKHYAEFESGECILKEATGNKPRGTNINVSLIYGDYFFVEAVAKLLGFHKQVF